MKHRRPFHVLGVCVLGFLCVGTVSSTATSAVANASSGRPASNADWGCFDGFGLVHNYQCDTTKWLIPVSIHSTGNLTFKVNLESFGGATASCRAVRFDESNQLLVTAWASTTSETYEVLTLGTLNVPAGFGAYVECNLPEDARLGWVSW